MNTLSYQEQLLDEQWAEKRKAILKRDGHCCRMCGVRVEKDSPLEIHHRYYKYGAMAWEYNDQALITLCRDCHDLVHKTLPPLIYYSNGIDLLPMNFTPCYRCNGTGWFREYNHVYGGICFRCNGQRYEELIDNRQLNHAEYIIHKDEIFDLLNPNVDEKTNEEMFNEAKVHHFGLCGDDSNWDIAEQLYHTAALNGYARAQNNYARYLELISPNKHLSILRFSLYSAMQGIYQAQKSVSDILKNHNSIELSDLWKKLSYNNEKRRNEQLVKDFFECSNDEEVTNFFNQLSPAENDLILEVLEKISNTK